MVPKWRELVANGLMNIGNIFIASYFLPKLINPTITLSTQELLQVGQTVLVFYLLAIIVAGVGYWKIQGK